MRDFLKSVFKGNPALWAVIFILIAISVVLMFSAISSVAYKYANYLDPFYGHVKHLVFGMIAMLIMSRIPYRILRRLYVVLLPITIVILFITPYIGVTLNGGTRAIRIAGFDVQPQEFAKLFIIMFLADILSVYQQNSTNKDITEDVRNANEKTYFWAILAVAFVTIMPIAVQNFSTAVMIALLTFIMMIVGRVNWKRMAILTGTTLGVGILVIVILINLPQSVNEKLPGHMSSIKGRIERAIADITTPDDQKVYKITDENRQPMHAKIAIASGRIPSGPGNSIQRDYLPLAFSDFIFAILIEESGWFGIILTMLSYLAMLFIAGTILYKSDKIYPSLLSIGLCTMIVMQAMISMCVAVGLGPVTGQPLPLISRGGSSILMTCIMLGIVLSISREIYTQRKAITEDANGESANQTTDETINQLND